MRISKLTTPSNSNGQSTPQGIISKSKHTLHNTPVITSVKARSRPGTTKEINFQSSSKDSTPRSNYLDLPKNCELDELDQFGMSQFCPQIKATSAQNIRECTDMFGLEPFSAAPQKSASKIDLFGAVPFNDLVGHHKTKRNDSFDIGILSVKSVGHDTRI